jgi:hypothetical protein
VQGPSLILDLSIQAMVLPAPQEDKASIPTKSRDAAKEDFL